MIALQPFQQKLAKAKRVLLAGCGGGYDIFGALPLLYDLHQQGTEIHLASLSFSYLNGLEQAQQHPTLPNLYQVGAASARAASYCPEAWLASFLDAKLGGSWSVWCFEKTGVRPLAAAYRWLIESLRIDALVLVDGGIDALLRGDESSLGTPSEDQCSLAATVGLGVSCQMLLCVGMGAELRDGICHAQALARVAELTREGAFWGVASYLSETPAGAFYRDAVAHTFANQSSQRQSHVHKLITEAMRGEFGAEGPHIWRSPLLSIAWCFALEAVVQSNLLAPHLSQTDSIWEVGAFIEAARKEMVLQPRTNIPL